MYSVLKQFKQALCKPGPLFSVLVLFGLMDIYFTSRLIFLVYNWDSFSNASTSEIILSFLLGLRFDLATIILINLPVLLYAFMPLRVFVHSLSRNLVLSYLIIVNGVFAGLNIVDVELYNYLGRRMTRDVLALDQDIQTEAVESIASFWGLSLITVIIWVFMIYASIKLWKYVTTKTKPSTVWADGILRFCLLVLFVVASRGGLQLKPINVVNAYGFSHSELAQLTLNTPFTLLKSQKSTQLPRYNWVDLDKIQLPKGTVNSINSPVQSKKNIVLIILESFALEYVGAANQGKGYTPFLDSLISEGVFFKNAFANGRRSIESIPSLLCGLPSLMRDAFITSQYQSNKIDCLPKYLKQRDYKTYFYHGAQNGTMYFDSFAKRVGIDQYFGLNEYPEKSDFDGTWGVYDEPYLQYVAKHLSQQSSPFFALVFTLSSHHPYKVPDKYSGKFPKGTLEIHESVGYADYALRQFFEAAKHEPWYENTLFVITADHTQKTDRPKYADDFGRYRVPLLFYDPNDSQEEFLTELNTDQVVQHVDLTPTLMDILNIDPKGNPPFGRSLFDNDSEPEVYNGNDEYYWWQDGKHLIEVRGGHDVRKYLLSEEGWGPKKLQESLPKEIQERALLRKQLYNQLMLDNQLVFRK